MFFFVLIFFLRVRCGGGCWRYKEPNGDWSIQFVEIVIAGSYCSSSALLALHVRKYQDIVLETSFEIQFNWTMGYNYTNRQKKETWMPCKVCAHVLRGVGGVLFSKCILCIYCIRQFKQKYEYRVTVMEKWTGKVGIYYYYYFIYIYIFMYKMYKQQKFDRLWQNICEGRRCFQVGSGYPKIYNIFLRPNYIFYLTYCNLDAKRW